jgi:hypothetical protein
MEGSPVLDPAEARQLLDAINTSTVIDLRDRALIGLMVYSFARIGAAVGMRVEDVYPQNRRLWLRLQEKGGKQPPCHHNLEAYLHEYIDGAGLANEPKAVLLQTYSRANGQLTGNPTAPGECLCDDSAARQSRRHHHSSRQSYLSGDGRHTAARWRKPRRWRTMPRRARRSSTTGAPRK